MIRANTRGRLTSADLQLVILLLSRGSAHRRAYLERRLATEGPDPLLDTPDLLERLLTVRTMLVPSEALFYFVVVRHALRNAGVDDRDLADYLAALLLEFGQRDRAWRVDWNDDQRHRYLVDILVDLDSSTGERRFRVMLHLGNYALWLAGLFPDYIAARHLRKGGPAVTYYDALGRRGFGMASDHALATEYGLDGAAPHRRRALSLGSQCAQRRERPVAFPDRADTGSNSSGSRRALTSGASRSRRLASSINARKSPRSGASASAYASSGCHCTASSQGAPGPVSTASISPSSLHPVATSPFARSRMAW